MKNTILKIAMFILVILTVSSCSKNKKNPVENENDAIPVPDGWKLVWNDEFENPPIDSNKWEYEVNAEGGGNNELQYYTNRPENSFIKDGCLVIQAIKEKYTGPEGTRDYTSARLRTKKKGDWKYGRFDIKAKLPYGQGLWPAIWMLPTDWLYGGWAASGEIDIVELKGSEPNKVLGTLHYGGEWPDNVHSGDSYLLVQGDFSDEFHVFTLIWEEQQFRWYVDDVFYQAQTQWHSSNGEYPAPYNQFFHLLLNVAVGGNFPGNPDNTTILPQEMTVDYVRVFKKK